MYRALALTSLLFLSACSKEPVSENSTDTQVKVTPVAVATPQDQPTPKAASSNEDTFNLEDVKQRYQNVSFSITDISERSFNNGNALAISFSIPLNPSENFAEYISVSSASKTVNGSWVLSESGKVAYFENIEPNQTYQIKVDWHLSSALGNQLNATANTTIKTRNVIPSVSFTSSGHLLPLSLSTGLPVTTQNISEVDVNFHLVDSENSPRILSVMGDRRKQGQYQLKQIASSSKLVHSARFELPNEPNKRQTFNLPLQEIPALIAPGLYVAVMQLPGTYEHQEQATFFMISDLGVHVRRYDEKLDIYVNSLSEAKAVTGAKVSLVDRHGVKRGSKLTQEGFAQLTLDKQVTYYLTAEYKDSFNIIPVNQAALDLSDFDLGKRPYQQNELFMYSERDLYRPGDTVNFSALLRDYDGKFKTAPPLKAKLRQANGQIAKEFSWHPSKTGYYETSYTIAKDAPVGNWVLEVSGTYLTQSRYLFKVEEFMPERLKLTFNAKNTDKQIFNPKDEIRISALGEYLYGAPASGNRFDASINIAVSRHPYEAFKTYFFGNELDTQWNESFKQENAFLNEQGETTVMIPSRWQNAKTPLKVSVFASLFESGGRPISRKKVVHVVPSGGLIGIRPAFEEYAPANTTANFDLIKLNENGDKVSAKDVSVILVKEDRSYHWEYNDHQGWHYEYTEKEITELSTSINISDSANNPLSLPVEYGQYRLEITDAATGYKTSFKFQAGEDWYAWWRQAQGGEQAARPDKVTLALDKERYRAGDTLGLTLVPPADGESIIVVEADKPLWSTRVHAPKDGIKLDIPIKPEWNRHDIYISVVHLQPAVNEQKITPTRAFGLIHLPLDRTDRKLSVAFDAPEKWAPDQTVTLNMTVTKQDADTQSPVNKAWLTVAAVDVGILSITDYETPKPHDFFFEQRRYGVDAIDMYNEIIALNDNALAKQRWGGDAPEVSRGGKQAQAEVQIVSLFSGLVEVVNGQAKIPLTLPNFNGRIRLMAVAFTDDSVGSSEQEVTIASPLVTQLAMPRFIAWGDQSTIALDINNLSGQAATLDINLNADGVFTLKEQKTLTINDKVRETLVFPIESNSGSVGDASKIRLSITGMKGSEVNREWTLNSRSPYPAVSQKLDKVLKANEELVLDKAALANMIPSSLQADVSASNTVDLNMRDQMSSLLRYPYGCLEQSTSSSYPWAFANDETLAKLDLKNSTKKSPAQNLEYGMDIIAKKQRSNGGFGLWSSQSSEEHWLTAYAGDFLSDVRQQGFTVNNAMYDKTMKRLEEYLNSSQSHGMRWSEKPNHYRFAYRAYAGYVLSRHNKASLGHLRSLANSSADSESMLPLVHLSLALLNQGDIAKSNEILDLAFTKTNRGDSYLGDYGSSVRDQALVIHLLTRHKVREDKVFELSLSLAKDLKERSYLSTQERNALFLAGLALESGATKEWQASLNYQQAKTSIKQAGAYTKHFSGASLMDGISIKNESDDLLYTSIIYNGYSTTAPAETHDKGISIKREYYDLAGKQITPSEMKVGDLMLIAVQVETSKRMPDLLVVDLLPAGLEIENQNLKHSATLPKLNFMNQSMDSWLNANNIVHQESRDDRFVAAIDVGWNQQAVVFYLVRAVTPGVYKVPVPYAEDMYNPEYYGVGSAPATITISQ